MPKCKPNQSIGIKLPWTLHSEDNWCKTHRVTGMFWVAGSVTMFLFLMVFESGFVSKILPILLIMMVGPILFSVLYYRKQLKEGSVSKIEKGLMSPANRSFTSSSVPGAIIVVIVAVIFISGTIEYRFDEESFTIKANYWENATVSYAEIDSVEYRENDLVGKRVMGFSSFSILMGEYDNSEFGAYTRYSYSKCKSCVVVRADDRVLVLNKKDETATKELYETLLLKTK
ncbi:MAG: SdpI family protein [Lachnospiraceae bacterium]|nr:SdpI family protein [Lachnospiraceae bacterium]